VDVERWCNQVAAEMLVPADVLQRELRTDVAIGEEVSRLARIFRVSTLVVLRRVYDVGGLTRDEFRAAYRDELTRIGAMDQGSGGDFYLTQAARVSKRFARALVVSTLEGRTLYADAFRLLGFSKMTTFHELGHSLGVA
jgi:Zn-dependent peptidase ImmA (M78 family)